MPEPTFASNLTEEQALALFETKYWEDMSPAEAAKLQLETSRLVFPFDVFHEGLSGLFGRPVYSHEMVSNFEGLQAEARGEHPAPSLAEILGLIPEENRIVVCINAGT